MANAAQNIQNQVHYLVTISPAKGELYQPEMTASDRAQMIEVLTDIGGDETVVSVLAVYPSDNIIRDIAEDIANELWFSTAKFTGEDVNDWDDVSKFIRDQFNNIDPREPSASEMGLTQGDYLGVPAQV